MDENTLHTYINEIANHLAEKKMYGAASLMIGAGFSKNAMSLKSDKSLPPNWSELANDMYDELYPLKNDDKKRIEECSGKNVLSLAQKYEVIFGRKKLNNLIEKSISDQLYEPSSLYEDLLKLEWEDIFTTNYDTLLERALSKLSLKREFKVIYSCKDLPNSTRPRLIKLHGSVDKSSDYIITEEDYRTYPTKYAPFVNTVQQAMLETQLCLIGFSGTDPNFLNWLGWLRDNMGDNCPRIFLCGYYDNLEYVDVKMLEKKNIIVLNLAPLINKNEVSNPYYSSIKKFIELLTEKTKIKENEIFDRSNLKYPVIFDKKKLNINDYLTELSKVTFDIEQKIQDYICLPQKDARSISLYCNDHLDNLLELKLDEFSSTYEIIGRLCYLLKRTFYPVYTIGFKKLQTFVFSETCDDLSKLKIGLFLLMQARILSDIKSYDEIFNKLNEIEIYDSKIKNELVIEKIKRKKLDFNFAGIINLINSIDDSESFLYMCIKANLYLEFGQKKLAENKLKEVTEFINKLKIEDNKLASAIGYARLVSISLFGIRSNVALDDEWIDNPYNTKLIVNKYRESVLETKYKELNEELSNYSFNPNSKKTTYKFNFGMDKKFEYSYGYQALIDSLCLGVYSDHKQICIDVINALEPNCETVYYAWNRIISSNDVNVCHQYFTREKIFDTNIQDEEHLFDCIYETLMSDMLNFESNKIFVLITFLSKLSIKLDDNRIIKLLALLVKVDSLNLDDSKTILNQSLRTIQYAFNYEILLKCIDFLKADALSKYYFSSYFIDYSYKEDYNKYIKKSEIANLILSKSKSTNRIDRTNTVSLLIIFSNYLTEKNREKIINNLLKTQDSFGFPTNLDWEPIIWKNEHTFIKNNSFFEYLCHPNLTRIYHNGGYHGNGGAIDDILSYEKIMVEMLIHHFEDFNLSVEEIRSILKYFNDYIENEKHCLGKSFGGIEDTVIETIENINIILGILLFYMKYSKFNIDDLNDSLNRYKELTSFKKDLFDFEAVLKNDNFDTNFQLIKKKFLSGKSKNVKIASRLMLLYLLFEEDKQEISNRICDILSSLEYFDINVINKVIPLLTYIVENNYFVLNHNQDNLIRILKYCIDLCSDVDDERRKTSFDCLYNISNLVMKYYKALIESGLMISNNLYDLIEIFKSIELNEIRNKWIDISKRQ